MFLLYYLYAILGITLFRVNDPTNFGALHQVLVWAAFLVPWSTLPLDRGFLCETSNDYYFT